MAAFAARYDIPVWLTFGTLEVVGERFDGMPRVYGFDSHDVFAIGDLEVRPFPVPHDAREPVQFVVTDGARRLGVLTDIGMTTPFVEASLSGLRCAGARMQPRRDLLANGDYPYPLKQRIAGRFGHLYNEAAAALLAALDTTRLSTSSPRTCRSRTTRPSTRAQRSPPRWAARADWIGIADQAERLRLARDLTDRGTTMEKRQELYRGKAKTVYATDDPHHLVMHYRDDVSAFDGVKLAKLERKGETNNKINAYVMGKLARRRRRDALRAPAERARVAGEGDEDGPGRMRRAQRRAPARWPSATASRRARGSPSRSSSSS